MLNAPQRAQLVVVKVELLELHLQVLSVIAAQNGTLLLVGSWAILASELGQMGFNLFEVDNLYFVPEHLDCLRISLG